MPYDRIIVAHPGTQHSYHIAAALKRYGMLYKFITNYYYKPNKFPYNFMETMPFIRKYIKTKSERRRSKDIKETDVIDVNPYNELPLILFKKIGTKKMRDDYMYLSHRFFEKFVSSYAKKHQVHAVVAYDTASYNVFKSLKHSKIKKVLDFSHPHVQGFKILQDEAAFNPEYAYLIDAPKIKGVIEKCLAEEQLADYILVASNFSKQCLIKDGVKANRIFIVPYGVDLSRFYPGTKHREKNEKLKLLFVGQITQRKGISYLIESFNALKSQNVELHITGGLFQGYKIPEFLKGDRIYYTGRVVDAELPAVYRNADIFVLPSLVEGFGLVLLEAMASGLPVITTPNSGGPDIIENGKEGFIVPVRNVSALVERIRFLLNNPDKREEMGRAARKKAEQYSWKTYEGKIGKFFRYLTGKTV